MVTPRATTTRAEIIPIMMRLFLPAACAACCRFCSSRRSWRRCCLVWGRVDVLFMVPPGKDKRLKMLIHTFEYKDTIFNGKKEGVCPSLICSGGSAQWYAKPHV